MDLVWIFRAKFYFFVSVFSSYHAYGHVQRLLLHDGDLHCSSGKLNTIAPLPSFSVYRVALNPAFNDNLIWVLRLRMS